MSNNGDKECIESWEQLEDSGVLEEQIRKINSKCSGDKNGMIRCGGISSVILVNTDGQMRFGPPEPSVKILKRPNGYHNNVNNSDDKPKQPIKTLQQREVEYARARERILGEAPAPVKVSDIPNETKLRILSESKSSDRFQPPEQRQEGNFNSYPNIVGVLRQPKGPDGSPGFTTPR